MWLQRTDEGGKWVFDTEALHTQQAHVLMNEPDDLSSPGSPSQGTAGVAEHLLPFHSTFEEKKTNLVIFWTADMSLTQNISGLFVMLTYMLTYKVFDK